jgi:hypothetical protein
MARFQAVPIIRRGKAKPERTPIAHGTFSLQRNDARKRRVTSPAGPQGPAMKAA